MADLFLDGRLPDYFDEHDWRRTATDDAARDAVLASFLGQRIGLIHGLDTRALDFDFLKTVLLPQTWDMKKFQFGRLVAEARAGAESALVKDVRDEVFAGDGRRFHRFVDQLDIAHGIAEAVTARLFDGHVIEQVISVARFSETRMENLHYDMDVGCDDHEAFRFYINLDAAPRIWSTSYQMTELVERGGRRLLEGIDPAWPGEAILKRVVSRAYGGWHQRATERIAPRHQVYFDPGDVWIVDGRSVSHQVTSGHRVLSVYVRLPHARNPDLHPTFAEKLHGAFARGMDVPPGQESALINYYPPTIIGHADLRGDWQRIFGDTRSGRVRRFDDTGLRATAPHGGSDGA